MLYAPAISTVNASLYQAQANTQKQSGSASNPAFALQQEAGASSTKSPGGKPGSLEDSPAYQTMMAQKLNRQNEVIAHELAHHTAAGHLSSGITYDYDSMGMIAGGQTHIKVPGLNHHTPDTTMNEARMVMAAAAAPCEMSSQDASVYAMASKLYFDAEQLYQKKLNNPTSKLDA